MTGSPAAAALRATAAKSCAVHLNVLKIDAVVRDVAVRARVGPAREQALQRIDRERQLLVRDLDLLERVARELFGIGRYGENRMADEQRLVRENRLLRRGRLRRLRRP